ncbi:MAG: hypothetical protein R3A44_10365 [Caldilineaceae bacterium]
MINTEQIKQNISIVDLIARRFTITGNGDVLSTEEHDSLKIFVNTNSYYWYDKARGGSVIDWEMNEEGKSLSAAISSLTGGINQPVTPFPALTATKRPVEAKPKAQEKEWIRDASRKLRAAQALLWESQGAPARAYLESRGLKPETWKAFGLGYAKHYGRSAIAMPWFAGVDQQLVAIRYRFIEKHSSEDANGKDQKQASLKGSSFAKRLFGGHCLRSYDGGHVLDLRR